MENTCVLVCVTDQLSCVRLIKKGRELADEQQAKLKVISVLPPQEVSAHTAQTLQALYNIACLHQAGMEILFDSAPAIAVSVYASQVNACALVAGAPDNQSGEFIEMLHALCPQIPLTVMEKQGHCFVLMPKKPNAKKEKSQASPHKDR